MKKIKENKKTLVTFDIDSDTYFEMLQCCVDLRMSIDEFVEMALKAFIEKHKEDKKKKKK